MRSGPAPRPKAGRTPRPRSSGPRRAGARAGSRAPRRRPGPAATPSNSMTCVAVEGGPDLGELLLLPQLGDAGFELVHAAAERGGLARVARRAVAARQLVQLVEQVGRRRARTGAPRCRSSPCGTCGSAGAARRASSRPRRRRSGSAARVSRFAAIRAPTTSWWWNVTPCGPKPRVRGLPTSCSSAASRSFKRGRGLGDDRDRVREHVLVPVDRILFELHRVELGQELVATAPCARSSTARATDRRRRNSFDSSSRIRSALTICEPLAHLLDRVARARRPARSRASRRSAPRAACAAGRRRTRSRATSGVRSRRRARSASPPNGSTSVGLVERDRHRVDREVAAREIRLDVVGERHLGLAALGPVHVGAERRDLEALAVLLAADRAEPLALQPHGVGPAPHRRLRSRRAGRRW